MSIDQYTMQVQGQLWTIQGSKKPDELYCGGMIFINHASGLVHVEHQLIYIVDETAHAKISF